MPRKSSGAVETGYLRSLWEECDELAREYNGLVTIVIYPTAQRGVFTVEFRALELGLLKDDQPVTHTITKRLPDGGTMPFAGALWDLGRKLNDMVTFAVSVRLEAITRPS